MNAMYKLVCLLIALFIMSCNDNKIEKSVNIFEKTVVAEPFSSDGTTEMNFILDKYEFLMNQISNDTISSINLLNLSNSEFKLRYGLSSSSELDSQFQEKGAYLVDYWQNFSDSSTCGSCALNLQ